MGEQKVNTLKDNEQMHRFVRHLLNDVESLHHMIEHDWFETDPVRIGAEQEMCLIFDRTFKPAPIAMEVLETMKDLPWVETELARFNLEINLDPRTFSGDCFSALENELSSKIGQIRQRLKPFRSNLILTGILPTFRKSDLELHNLTPKTRYKALMDSINDQLIGSGYELRLMGIDELLVKHDSPLLEACNTSFQVHLQVAPSDFVHMHNISQALAAPVMAIAANSPIVFGRRLWHESRIALFQQALDTRTTHDHMRERSPRVNFGNEWLDQSILEIYKEDIARFRVLLAGDVEEDSAALIRQGKVPRLRALQVHNSTVYRWNRPCYGISPNGKPHLRIENRVLPAGPTIIDEVANAAFWLGAVTGLARHCPDITTQLSFADIKDNFVKAARYGIDATFTWLNDQKLGACDLILKELLPIAREGLELQQVKTEDIDRTLHIIEERAKSHRNGARWMLRAYSHLQQNTNRDEALSALTSSIVKNQQKELPVHTWPMPELHDLEDYHPAKLKVEECMTTDLFTVQKDDIVELVAEMMDWRKVRYTPVEDKKGQLVGLVTSRLLLRHFSTRSRVRGSTPGTITVKDLMIEQPITINPKDTILKAMEIMRDKKIGCLPVVTDNELVGIITEMDFLRISHRLMERIARRDD
ncbi:MAG: glutamate-cysteine ligase family protein [Saprospiraceae bacterium]|jgi:CBS domain-containing protein/gamma-glutamylcysteine synthetase